MLSPLTAKEQVSPDTPLFLFDCTMTGGPGTGGTVQHWSSRSLNWKGTDYEGRVLRHNVFEAQLASDTQIGGAPRLTLELANADSRMSELEQQTGFKGGQLLVRLVFFDLVTGAATTDEAVVFRGLLNPPESITETTFRLSAINRISMQRSVVPNVRVQRLCPWRFPANPEQRAEAVSGSEARGKYSPFYRCGYSPDQPGGVGNLNGTVPFTACSHSRSDCEQRGMFTIDSSSRNTSRFGGIEYMPPTILVRGTGQKASQLSAVQDNTASYNNFVPLVYGTQWHVPDVVFSRNDGNLTRMEVLLGMGEIDGIVSVLVNDIQIPQGVNGRNMTATGWYNLMSAGTRNGHQDNNFGNAAGTAQGDPYGTMAYLSVVVPNRVNDGTSIPRVQVLLRGLKLWQFDTTGNLLSEQFSSNPVWVLLDVLMRCGYSKNEMDLPSFARCATYAAEAITVTDPLGGTVQIPRFECNFALKQSQTAGEIIRAIRNGSRVYLVLNSRGLLEARIENTFALQNPVRPAGSNSVNAFDGGWPAYEFDASSIARGRDGGSSVKLSKKGAQDTPNRLSIEFQDSFNQFQQDSLSLTDEDDFDRCGQEVAARWSAAGISTFNQASRMLLLGLNRAISGNLFIEFETSVKALGLLPGDLITVTCQKENLVRTPFRITKIAPGGSYRTATITAQLHDDSWYSDFATGVSGGLGRQTGRGSGLPAPVTGVNADESGKLQLGVAEAEVAGSDGSTSVELAVSFTGPSGKSGAVASPLLGLVPVGSVSGGTLPGGAVYFYAVSAVDSGGGEGPLSFMAQAITAAGGNANTVELNGIVLPAHGVRFHVYRGTDPQLLFRIASDQTSVPSFTDGGLLPQPVLPADSQFDHVNAYWRWELLPETPAAIHSANTVGNTVLTLRIDQYKSATVRITKGNGAGQERTIGGNTATILTVSTPWTTAPDASSSFVIAENGWRFGAHGSTSPVTLSVPERIGTGVQISVRAANTADSEAPYDLSPVTRWVLGQSGGLAADSLVPPAPVFGLAISPSRGGVINLGSIGFPNLVNTTGITAGTYTFYFYDEISGPAPGTLAAPGTAPALRLAFGSVYPIGALLQIGQEIVKVLNLNTDGTTTVVRGIHGTEASEHDSGTSVYKLSEKVVIVPFVKRFFGSSASGDWKYSLELPGVRVASVKLFMTNALGAGAATVNPYTATIDSGLRTLAGGQFSFQISGYLAIQTDAAPPIVVDAGRSIRDIYGILRTPAAGSGVQLELKRNGTAYTTVEFAAGATTSTVVNGFGLTPLQSGDLLSVDTAAVGTINPGSDLTLIIRL